MIEQKMHTLENARMKIAHPGKWQKNHTRKITEKSKPRKWRNENARHGKWQKMHTLENNRKVTPGKWQNGKCTRGKWQKNHTLENDRKLTIWICQNGKYTPLKMPEQKLHALETDRKLTHQCWNGGISPLQISTILGPKMWFFHYCLIFPKCQSWGPLGSIWTYNTNFPLRME